MNTPTRTRPGHWSDVPTAAEIEAADEQHAASRPPVAAVGTGLLALILAVVFVAWLARFFLMKG